MTGGIQGLDKLRSTLKYLADDGAKKAAKAGVNAGLAEIVKAIRAGVNSSSMSPEAKQAVRQTIAKRLRKKEGQDYTGKAGFGVGKRTSLKKQAAHARYVQGQGGGTGGRGGTGISSTNVHWLLGTKGRMNKGTARPVMGREGWRMMGGITGRMPDLLTGIISNAVAGCQM
jgi:hypothetical protein